MFSLSTGLSRARARSAAAFPKRLLLTKRASGTNGWMSSWGTNAHGEIAGCPPSRRLQHLLLVDESVDASSCSLASTKDCA